MKPWEKDKTREVSVSLTDSQLEWLKRRATRGISAEVRHAVTLYRAIADDSLSAEDVKAQALRARRRKR